MTEHTDDLRHVSRCRPCRERFVSRNVAPFPAGREARRRELFDVARKLQQEKETSAGIVARLLRTTPTDEWPTLAEHPDLRNSAALEQIGEEVRRLLDREPLQALALSNVATAIAESLPPRAYPETVHAQLRATAWKDRANALRYLARYPEAIEAVNMAEERLAPHPALAYDRAIVRLVKAMVSHQVGDTETANSLLRNCRAVFESYGDRERAAMAGMIEANFLYGAQRFEEARTLYSRLLTSSPSNLEAEAGLHSNIGHCAIHLGDYVAANMHLSNAIARFTEIGQYTTALKTEWGAGSLLIRKGQVRAGIERLMHVRASYLERGLVQDAGLTGLEIIEALSTRGDHDEARQLASAIRSELGATEMDRYAAAAFERLELAIESGSDCTSHVHDVSEIIRSLPVTIAALPS